MYLWSTVTAVSFWLGTLLPVLYLPVFITGIDSVQMLSVLLALLAVNVVALVVGHGYEAS